MFLFKLIIHKFLTNLIIHKFKFLYITVSEIQSPPATYDGHVDIEEFWNAVAMDMISRGFSQVLILICVSLHDNVIDIMIWLSVINLLNDLN